MDSPEIELLADLPRERTWVLPALLRVQRRLGYVSDDAISAIAAHLRLTVNDVDGIATGYPELRRTAPAGIVVRVCDGLACVLAGSDGLRASLERDGSPGLIEIDTVACLFACAQAPVIEIGAECLGRVTSASALEALHNRASG